MNAGRIVFLRFTTIELHAAVTNTKREEDGGLQPRLMASKLRLILGV
jgi:hypothetical protein